jgi:cholinesterase
MSFVSPKIGEDCLFINVWTKPKTGTKLPVMVWITGGAFTVGDSSWGLADGSTIAQKQDIIVVSFNYRVNVFGFPGAPGVDANPGLLDQRMAVEWTRDNIEAFGGDPNRITIFGESAGGSSVDVYAFAWKDDPIASAFIAESGTALTSDLFKPASKALNSWYSLTKGLGCGGADAGQSTLECAQKKTVSEIQGASLSGMTMGKSSGGDNSEGVGPVPGYRPIIDEKTVFSDIVERTKNGLFARKVRFYSNFSVTRLSC